MKPGNHAGQDNHVGDQQIEVGGIVVSNLPALCDEAASRRVYSPITKNFAKRAREKSAVGGTKRRAEAAILTTRWGRRQIRSGRIAPRKRCPLAGWSAG